MQSVWVHSELHVLSGLFPASESEHERPARPAKRLRAVWSWRRVAADQTDLLSCCQMHTEQPSFRKHEVSEGFWLMRSRFFVHLTAAFCLRTAAVMDRAPSLTHRWLHINPSSRRRRFLLHHVRLPIQNKNSRMCQLKLPFPLICLLKDVFYLKEKPHLFIYADKHLEADLKEKTSQTSELQRHNLILLLCRMKKLCPGLFSTFYFMCRIKMFRYSLSSRTSDQTFNRLIKSAFEVSCTVLMSSC